MLLLVLAVGNYLVRTVDKTGPAEPLEITGDAAQYLRMAWNLQRHGVLSQDEADTPRPAPTAYRCPGYPVFLALFMVADETRRKLPLSAYNNTSHPALSRIELWQRLLYLTTGVGAMLLTWRLTDNRWAALVCLVLVLFVSYFRRMPNYPFSENLIAFGVVWTALACAWAAHRGRWYTGVAAGLALAGLTLSRAVFLYATPVVALAVALWVWRRGRPYRRSLPAAAAFALAFTIPVGGWMTRNYAHFDRFYLTGRGGGVLSIRAEINEMTATEYAAAFLYWGNSWTTRSWAREHLLPRVFEREDYQRFDRARTNTTGFYQSARRRKDELYELHDGDRAAADKALTAEAKRRILRHPVRHLLASIPLAYRGLCVEKYLALSLLLFAGAVGAAVIAWRRRSAPLAAALLVPGFSYAFHTGLTHNLARYNTPLVPALWAFVVVACHHLIARRRNAAVAPTASDTPDAAEVP